MSLEVVVLVVLVAVAALFNFALLGLGLSKVRCRHCGHEHYPIRILRKAEKGMKVILKRHENAGYCDDPNAPWCLCNTPEPIGKGQPRTDEGED